VASEEQMVLPATLSDDAPHLLVVDDDRRIRDLLSRFLSGEGYRVTTAETAADARAKLNGLSFDLLILDVMMPGESGFDFAKSLRGSSSVPILMLTARDAEVDRVLGLELGADDYVTKPFSPPELVARVKAVLRRADGVATTAELLQVGGVTIDLGRREVRVGDEPVGFTGKEFDLLKFLAERPGFALSRQQILDGVWGYDWFGDARTVDVHIAQVRKKLADTVRIDTVRGVGYRLDPK